MFFLAFLKKKQKKTVAVFLSRTFGGFLRLSQRQLWLLPLGQGTLLAGFVASPFLFGALGRSAGIGSSFAPPPVPPSLLFAFATGLLGGLGYVATFTLLAESIPHVPLRALSLAATSVADSAGIALADGVSVVVQGCLFRAGGFASQATFKCGAAA